MSSRSYLIDTTQSMIIVDPNDFPLVMGATAKNNEDKPTTLGEVMAYDGRNILPTPAGYMSYFDQSTKIDIGDLAGKLVQEIFFYQSANLHSVAVALCEDGIYIANATTGFKAVWTRIVDLSAGVVVGVRRLWTVAVVANRTIMYQKGQDKFWALVTPDRYADAATPSPITGATVAQVWTNWGAGLLSYVPTFLNMTGQVGLFRADNRLGFWDSDSAVSWSSNLYIEDFTPSVKTFAGVTKFADVAGSITKILGAGDGFIIYATKSIVYGGALEGSPEKWRGEAILSGQGVSFDTQITAGQPDTKQYCVTSAGLMVIDGRSISAAAPGVIDYLALNNKVLSLKMIEGRYLFIHCAEEFTGSKYGVAAQLLPDFNGNEYLFPPPDYSWVVGTTDWFNSVIDGKSGLALSAFRDYSYITGVTQPTTETLIPCYDVHPFDSNWAGEVFEPVVTGEIDIDSKISAGHVYVQDDAYVRAQFGLLPSYYLKSTVFDAAGEELADAITSAMDDVASHVDYQTAWFNALGTLITPVLEVKPTPIGGPTAITETYTEELVGELEFFNHILMEHLKVDANECRIHLYVDRYSTLKAQAKFTGIEQYLPAMCTEPVAGVASHDGYAISSLVPTSMPKLMLGVEVTQAYIDELRALIAVQDPSYLSTYNTYATLANLVAKGNPSAAIREVRQYYLGWMLSVPEAAKACWLQNGTMANEYLPIITGMMTNAGISRTVANLVKTVSDYPEVSVAPWYMTSLQNLNPPAYYNSVEVDVDTVYVYKRRLTSGTYTYYTRQVRVTDLEVITSTQIKVSSRENIPTPPGEDVLDSTWKVSVSDPGWTIGSFPSGATQAANDAIWTSHPGGFYSNGVGYVQVLPLVNSLAWNSTERTNWYAAAGFGSSAVAIQYLQGSLVFDVEYVPEEAETEITLLDMDMSGWGYMPYGGFSFRKTHSRHGSTTCDIPGKSTNFLPAKPGLDKPFEYTPGQQLVNSGANPPYQWDYPTTLPLPDNYALFQIGSLAPYYPTYVGAVVYDQVQEKWGKFDAAHKLVYEINPINRADETITLNPDTGMLAGSLNPVGLVSMFGPNNPEGLVVYGKIGYYRLGMTTMQEARAYFNAPAVGNIIVEASIDGTNIDPTLSYAVELNGQTTVLLNFTSTAKWFNIRIEGQFRLITLQVNLESAGRR